MPVEADVQTGDSLPRSFPGTGGIGIGGPGLMLFLKSIGFDLPTPLVYGVGIVSIIALLIAAVQLSSWSWHHLRRWVAHAKAKKLEPFYLQVIGLAGVIVFGAVALAGIFWQHARSESSPSNFASAAHASDKTKPAKPTSPFAWQFETVPGYHFIGSRFDPTSGRIDVFQFQATGSNGTGDPISKADGYVRSDRTGRKYPIKFNIGGVMYAPTDVDVIPVGARIDVHAYFKDDRSSVTVRDLLDQIAPFTFFFEYDGKEYRSPSFSVDDVEDQIQIFEKQARAGLPNLAPAMRPKTHPEKDKLTVQAILGLYEGRTPLQADKLVHPFKGQSVESEGAIVNVFPDGRPEHSTVVLAEGKYMIECRFGPEWAEKISRLSKGDFLKYRGIVSNNQNGSQLYLRDCEIRS